MKILVGLDSDTHMSVHRSVQIVSHMPTSVCRSAEESVGLDWDTHMSAHMPAHMSGRLFTHMSINAYGSADEESVGLDWDSGDDVG